MLTCGSPTKESSVFRRHTNALAHAARIALDAAGELTIASEREGDRHVVTIAGELDVHSAGRLDVELKRVEGTDAREIVVDLGCLEFIDSAGMHVFIRAGARSRSDGDRLVIMRGPDRVHRPFELCGLESRLPFAR
jgi:anti-sigma B factor antagonist